MSTLEKIHNHIEEAKKLLSGIPDEVQETDQDYEFLWEGLNRASYRAEALMSSTDDEGLAE